MSCNHNFEDYWGSGLDKCLDCGATRRSRYLGVVTHLIDDEDGSLYPNPACPLYHQAAPAEISPVSITVVLADGSTYDV